MPWPHHVCVEVVVPWAISLIEILWVGVKGCLGDACSLCFKMLDDLGSNSTSQSEPHGYQFLPYYFSSSLSFGLDSMRGSTVQSHF